MKEIKQVEYLSDILEVAQMIRKFFSQTKYLDYTEEDLYKQFNSILNTGLILYTDKAYMIANSGIGFTGDKIVFILQLYSEKENPYVLRRGYKILVEWCRKENITRIVTLVDPKYDKYFERIFEMETEPFLYMTNKIKIIQEFVQPEEENVVG